MTAGRAPSSPAGPAGPGPPTPLAAPLPAPLPAPLEVWRIVASRLVGRAFDGEGARRHGGRWNLPGTPVVYTSASLSLAALELFVHLDPDHAPDDLVAIPARLPAGLPVAAVDPAALPAGWRTYPAPEALAELGSRWIAGGGSAALRVPSAVIPHEENVLLAPGHPGFAAIDVGAAEPFAFDPRMRR